MNVRLHPNSLIAPMVLQRRPYQVISVQEGHCSPQMDGTVDKKCTCTLIKGKYNVVINTMTAWDEEQITGKLNSNNLTIEDVHYVVSTSARAGFFGCNYVFPNSIHIIGHSISRKNHYFDQPFIHGADLKIDDNNLRVITTPGRTLYDVTVLVRENAGLVAITGDLFENEEDTRNDYGWIRYTNGSEYPILHQLSRKIVVRLADYIIPGHGKRFRVTKQIRKRFLDRDYPLI